MVQNTKGYIAPSPRVSTPKMASYFLFPVYVFQLKFIHT